MSRIESISLSGIRGIKEKLFLELKQNSVLIFGENGTGKSSITDSVEWFYKGKVSHLSGEEIGPTKTGKEALRNVLLEDTDTSSVEILYKKNTLNNQKSLDKALSVQNSNTTKDFTDYLSLSESERLILRFQDLLLFVTAGKTDKLKELQAIIGFEEVGEIRSLLKKMAGKLARDIKSRGFSDKKSSQQNILIDCYGQNIVSPKQFYEASNELIKPLNLEQKISSIKDAKLVLRALESQEDATKLEEITFRNKIADSLATLNTLIDPIDDAYKAYQLKFAELKKDSAKLNNLQLLKLLTEASRVLQSKVYKEGFCPVCEQESNQVGLLTELNKRIDELKELETEQKELAQAKGNLQSLVEEAANEVKALLKERGLTSKENVKVQKRLEALQIKIVSYSTEMEKDIFGAESLSESKSLLIDKKDVAGLIAESKAKVKQILAEQEGNSKIQIAVKLAQGIAAYTTHRKLEKEEEILTKQKNTFESLYSDFVKRQEAALDGFLKMFSSEINKYYGLMNPGERVEDICLVPIKNRTGDELEGITIQFKFFGTVRKPPTALLSESHVNCLGIAFFLASVRAFNKENKFFVLDDVISSFDSNHRIRFIRLLLSEFSDHQILLLTHESDFFEYASREVKSKNWQIQSLTWTDEKGTCMEGPPLDLLETIVAKIKAKDTNGLGNDIRKYAEWKLKIVANEIEAKFAFRFNSINEDRMLSELLTGIQSSVNKHSSTDLKIKHNIDQLLASPLLIANKTSHDSLLTAKFGDLDVFWEDINKLLGLFSCKEAGCNSMVGVKFYDTAKKQIRCKCGTLAHNWIK